MELYRGRYRTVVAARYGRVLPAAEYLDGVSEKEKARLEVLYQRLADTTRGQIFNPDLFRHEGEQIFCFRPGACRLFSCFHPTHLIVLLNGYQKTTRKMPAGEFERAKRIRAAFIATYEESR